VADGDCLITPQLTINRTVIGDPKKDHKQMLADLAAVVQELRREAKAKG